MRGYPKHLNTRTDFDYVRKHYPKDERWIAALRNLVSTASDWAFVRILDSKEDGVVDETHKIENVSDDPKTEMWAQYEHRINEKAKIFRLGFTVEEVEKILSETGANADA